mmetsp:Transcript_18654/g.37833  ORF Transcript_18654/g.37833 Transcript_18654/m.37833 type:complete len:263 (-) Transcript_18654:71-859(-)
MLAVLSGKSQVGLAKRGVAKWRSLMAQRDRVGPHSRAAEVITSGSHDAPMHPPRSSLSAYHKEEDRDEFQKEEGEADAPMPDAQSLHGAQTSPNAPTGVALIAHLIATDEEEDQDEFQREEGEAETVVKYVFLSNSSTMVAPSSPSRTMRIPSREPPRAELRPRSGQQPPETVAAPTATCSHRPITTPPMTARPSLELRLTAAAGDLRPETPEFAKSGPRSLKWMAAIKWSDFRAAHGPPEQRRTAQELFPRGPGYGDCDEF